MQHNSLRKIHAQELSVEAFAPYGKVVSLPDSLPNKIGQGWKCWLPVSLVSTTTDLGLGMVVTQARPLIVTEMERHVSREEILWPTDKAVIQPMALPKDLEDPDAAPDPDTVRAFVIMPGQAVVMAKGAWHSAAYPIDKDTLYFFAIEEKDDAVGDMSNPWIAFPADVAIEVVTLNNVIVDSVRRAVSAEVLISSAKFPE